jgi:heme/copper-type cytochrome/quinol oxidase subunit 2
MTTRRVLQSLLLLALCVFVAACLRGLYLVGVAVAAGVAISSGVLVLWGIVAAVVWPVLVVAYALHRFSGARDGRAPEYRDRR